MPAPGFSLIAAHPAASQQLDPRARALEGMVQAVADKGYAATTVADAVRAGRLSRGTFYALFSSKEDCFLEAYRRGVDVLDERIERAVRATSGDWRAKLRAALREYLQGLAAEPRFARTYLVEIHAAGPAAQAARDDALRRFAERYRASFEAARGERGAPPRAGDALFVLASGVDQLVSARVRAGALDPLDELEDTLVDCAVALLEGMAAMHAHDPNGGRPTWT